MRQHGPVALLGEDLVLVVQLGAVPNMSLLNVALVHTEGGHNDLGLRDLAASRTQVNMVSNGTVQSCSMVTSRHETP